MKKISLYEKNAFDEKLESWFNQFANEDYDPEICRKIADLMKAIDKNTEKYEPLILSEGDVLLYEDIKKIVEKVFKELRSSVQVLKNFKCEEESEEDYWYWEFIEEREVKRLVKKILISYNIVGKNWDWHEMVNGDYDDDSFFMNIATFPGYFMICINYETNNEAKTLMKMNRENLFKNEDFEKVLRSIFTQEQSWEIKIFQ